jgi:GntR family transcriptional regulator, transcriptional repressor for pyruvate dehydrogenase complex
VKGSEPESGSASGRARRGEKVAVIIAREIVHDIVDRGLTAGAKLPAESDMLDKLAVGRATLREALRILEVQGLISIRPGPGGGPVVVGATSRDFGSMATLFYQMCGATFRELVEARQIVEPLMARLAAERRDAEDMVRLRAAIDAARVAAVEVDKDWTRTSSDFHGVVAGLSGNRVLDLFGEALKDVWTERISGTVFPSQSREQVREDHEAIARAIADGDGAEAERLMREHMIEFSGFVAERSSGLLDEVVDWR